MRTLITRIAVAVVAIPVLLWVFQQGGWWLQGLIVVLIVIGTGEAERLLRIAGKPAEFGTPAVLAVLVAFAVSPMTRFYLHLVAPVVVLIAGLLALGQRRSERAWDSAVGTITIAFWLGLGFGALAALRGQRADIGFALLLFLFANLWIGDTAAYSFGKLLGKRRLAESISPNKTIAGAVAQVFASAVIGLVFFLFHWLPGGWMFCVSAALTIAIVGQAGDLFESCLKRMAGVKDSSAVIPGHGGVLDRFDSTLFAAPSLWVLVRLWGL